MGRRVSRLLVFACLFVFATIGFGFGCSGGCRGSKAPLQYVPEDALVVVEVPSLARAARRALALVERFKEGPLVSALISGRKALLAKQLGFSPDKPGEYRNKGIEPKAGLVFALANDGGAMAAMGVADAKALDKYLRELLTKELPQAGVFKDVEEGGLKVTVVRGADAQSRVRGGWAFHGKHLLMAVGGDDIPKRLAQLSKLERSVKDNKSFMRQRKRLGSTDVLLYVDGAALKKRLQRRYDERFKQASELRRERLKAEKEISEGVLAYLEGWALGLELKSKSVSLRSFLGMPEGRGAVLKRLLAGKGTAPELGKFIGPDAILVARAALQLKVLVDRALELVPPRAKRRLYRQLERFERRNNLSVEKDILALLAGRYGFALYAPTAEALQQPPSSLEDAASLVQGVFFAQVTDRKKAAELLRRFERFLVMARADVRTRTRGERKVYTLERRGKSLLSWTLSKDLLVVASTQRLEATLTLIDKGGRNVLGELRNRRAKGLLKDGEGNVLYQDLSKALDVVRAVNLPTRAKLFLSPVLGSFAKLDDICLGVVAEVNGLYGELALTLK